MAVLMVGQDKLFTRIIDAYNVACNGDTLFIDEGEYTESIHFDEKVVNLIGNTSFPSEGKVIINSSSSSTVDTKYNDDAPLLINYADTNIPISILIEGIKFESNINGYQHSIIDLYLFVSTQVGKLSLIFNKCIIDGTNGVESSLVAKSTPYTGQVTSSIVFNNCKIIWQEGNTFIGDGTYTNINNFTVEKTILSGFPTNTFYSSLDYVDITRSLYTDYYGDTYEYDMPVVGYGPYYGKTLSYDYVVPTHCFSGIVSLNGVPVQRELRFFRSDNNVYVGSTTSAATGAYYKEVFSAAKYDIICLDDSSPPYYNDLIMSKCVPIAIPYQRYTSYFFELINASAEFGDTTGWTEESGSFTIAQGVNYNPYHPTYSFRGSSLTGTDILSQRIDLVGSGISTFLIDTGELFIYVEHMNSSVLDYGWQGIRCLDATQTMIGTVHYSERYDNSEAWTKEVFICAVASGTRYIDVILKSSNNSVSGMDVRFSNIVSYIRKPL